MKGVLPWFETGDSMSTYEKVLLWLIRWARPAGVQEIFCPALAALSSSVQNIFFLAVHFFTSLVPILQQAGQAVVPGRLSLNMCLYG